MKNYTMSQYESMLKANRRKELEASIILIVGGAIFGVLFALMFAQGCGILIK